MNYLYLKITEHWKKLKRMQRNGNISPVHGFKQLILLKWPYNPVYKFSTVTIKLLMTFFKEKKNTPKICMEPQIPQIANAIPSKNNRLEGL